MRAGSVVGSGTVSNADLAKGWGCIAEKRALEVLEGGAVLGGRRGREIEDLLHAIHAVQVHLADGRVDAGAQALGEGARVELAQEVEVVTDSEVGVHQAVAAEVAVEEGVREEAEGALGARFDVRAFHDAVLSLGSVPLDLLRERIRAWIAERQAADAGTGNRSRVAAAPAV